MTAATSTEIREIKVALQNQCPPKEECSISCVELIGVLEQENVEQNEKMI